MEMTVAQRLGQEAYSEVVRLLELPETAERIIAEARKQYPKLPALTDVKQLDSGYVGIDKDKRRWVINGLWVSAGIFDMDTIIRETRRQHRMDWLLGGQANTNCKNVWGVSNPIRIVFPEIEKLMKAYSLLVH